MRASLASVVEMLEEDLDALQWIDDSDEDCIAEFGVRSRGLVQGRVRRLIWDQIAAWK